MAKDFRVCAVEGCANDAGAPGAARGWCPKHYQRWKRCGDAAHVDIDRGAAMRFINEVALPFEGEDCLLWPFARYRDGYGQVWFEGRLAGAHRVVCQMAHGEPENDGLDAAHSCGNGHDGCVNPGHLRWATRAANFADMAAHGTKPIGEQAPWAKLTDDGVRQIRRLALTMQQKDIAVLMGVSKPTISAVLSGKRWAHVA